MKRIFLILPVLIMFQPLYVSAIEIIFQGSVNETYDDNINTSGTAPESDWLTNIMFGITANSEIRVLDFNLSGHIYQRLSVFHPENNANSQDLMFSLNKDFSENFTLRIEEVFQHYPEAASFEILFGRNNVNTGYYNNNLLLNVNLFITNKLFITGTYINGILNNESDQLLDSISHSPGGAIGYSFNTANIVRIGYTYQMMTYDNGEKTRADTGYAEYEKYFTKQLRSIIRGGYDYIDTSEGQSLNKRWLVSLIDDVDSNNQLNITYMNGNTISNIMNDVLKNWTISMYFSRQISERSGFGLSLFFGKGAYDISGIKDKILGVTASFSYIINDFVNFNTGYTFTWYRSSAPGGGDESAYKRNQFSAGLSALY